MKKALFILAGFITLCISCKPKQLVTQQVYYKKYNTGIGGGQGVIFYFKIPQRIAMDNVQSVYINDAFVPYTIQTKGDTLIIEANAFREPVEKGFDPEGGKPTTSLDNMVLNASHFEGYVVFLQEDKQDSIHFTEFESLTTDNQNPEP